MTTPDQTGTSVFGLVLLGTWLGFAVFFLLRESRVFRSIAKWFHEATAFARVVVLVALVAVTVYGGSKGGNNQLRTPHIPVSRLVVDAPPRLDAVSVSTNHVAFRAESATAVEGTAWRKHGALDDALWLDFDEPVFAIGTNPVSRLCVSSAGAVSFESVRRPHVGTALPDRDRSVLLPFRTVLGFVPEANWTNAGAESRFWHDAVPGGGRVLAWENELADRLPGRRVSYQVELEPSGDCTFRYDFHDALDPPPTNFVIGAQTGTNGVNALAILGSNTLAATVWRVDGMRVTNGVSIADLVCTNGVLRTPAAFEIRWRNTTGLDPEADTDDDGLTDWTEVFVYGTDPNHADTDGDGIADNAELVMDMNPRNPDTDGDGMADGWDADPTTPAATPAFGQSAAWLAAAGVDGTTNALEWAQGVVATNEDAHVLGISVANATPAFPASVSLSGFPTVVLDDDATLWFPVAVADPYAFDFICDAELEIGIVEPPLRLLPRSGNDDVHTVEGSDGWNLVSTARRKSGWYMRKPWQQLRNCTGEINSTWMSFEVETRPRKGGTYTWSSMPEEFLRRVDGNRALCLWPDDSLVGTAMIRVVWEKDAFAVTNFLVVGRPPRQEGETPLLSLDIDGGTEGIVFVQTNGLGQVILQDQDPAYLICRVASTSAVASVTLDCPQSGKVRVRTMVNGHETEIPLPYNWNPQTTGTETAFRVLGAETSDAVRDIRFTATIPDTPVSASADMTVARVEHATLSAYPQGCSRRTSLGVGEEVRLSVIPNGTYPGGCWSARSGGLETVQDSPVAYAEAPYRAGILNVTFAYLGKQADNVFEVLEPVKFMADASAVTPTSFLGPNHAGGLSAYIDPIFLFPTNVSFYRVATMEGICNASDIEGYFTYCDTNSLVHGNAEGAGTWTPTEEDNYAGADTAAMDNEIPMLPFVDGTSGWIPGQFRFQIPLYYRIRGGSSHRRAFSCPDQPATFFANGTQTYLLDAMGTLSIEKFSLRTTCDTNRFITVTTIP